MMFMSPTNKLLHSFEDDAPTINTSFGISFGNVQLGEFDDSDYDCIVFAEFYFSNMSTY